MDVIRFPCVSLGSSTVQLHDSLCSRRACACSEAGFSSQNGYRVSGVYYRRAAFCCVFLCTKGLSAKDIHKEMFPVYGGKCLSRKAVHSCGEKFSQGRSKVADDTRQSAKVAETTDKRLYAVGFDALVKRWDKCINVGGRYVDSIITCFTFYIHL
jgi:hypothetical protein